MDALKVFMLLPHLDGYQRVISDWGYTPSLYHFDSEWHVSWVHCEEGDSLQDFSGKTPEEAIDNAFKWCKENELI